MTIPNGLYIWQLQNIRPDYISKLVTMGCKRVYLKVLDDASNGIFWSNQCTKENIKTFNDAGIEVVGWGYIFDGKISTDTQGIVSAVKKAIQTGCIGFVVDLEIEVENTTTHKQVREILQELKHIVPEGQLGYTSFGNPLSHPNIPWKILHDLCDYQQPQIYYSLWSGNDNLLKIQDALRQHLTIGINKKPIYPIFTTEPNGIKTAKTSELQVFLNMFPGSSIYEAEFDPSWYLDYSSTKKTPATWFDVQRNGFGNTTVTAYAGSTPVDQVTSNWKSDILAFLSKHDQAASIMVAPANKPIPQLTTTPNSINEKLAQFYSVKTNYDRVYVDVMSWYGTLDNACVAFMSTALRMVGYNVPKTTNNKGENISLVTTPFSNYLVSQGWKRIKLNELLPGDICFSIETDDPGYPSHTYMFAGWESKLDSAFVIDNQGFTHSRNMVGGPLDAFAYALRSS